MNGRPAAGGLGAYSNARYRNADANTIITIRYEVVNLILLASLGSPGTALHPHASPSLSRHLEIRDPGHGLTVQIRACAPERWFPAPPMSRMRPLTKMSLA